jgi:3-phosphoshikimate 1-carboxyvinyltransferase
MQVPGDPSSAAFLIALATLANDGEVRVRDIGMNPTRIGFFEALRRMGADLKFQSGRVTAGEPIGDVVARPARLRAISVQAEDVPAMIDELPLLACVATRAEGETRITGAEELRAKESDRIAVIVANLRALGAEVEELKDGLIVKGSDKPLVGTAKVHHDHRIAMAFGVLAAMPGNRIVVDDPSIVDISFPGFWEILEELTRGAAPRT